MKLNALVSFGKRNVMPFPWRLDNFSFFMRARPLLSGSLIVAFLLTFATQSHAEQSLRPQPPGSDFDFFAGTEKCIVYICANSSSVGQLKKVPPELHTTFDGINEVTQ